MRVLYIFLVIWSTQANAVLWRLGSVTQDSINIFATTGNTKKTITVEVPGVGSFSAVESVWSDKSDGSPDYTYYTVITVTGLQPWSDYTYKISEDSVEKGGGSFRTLPADQTTPFEIALIGCDNSRSDGLYDMIANRSYSRGGELVAIMHVDDIGYLDAMKVTNVEGVTSTGYPRDTKLAYDYVAAWLEPLGGGVSGSYDQKDWVIHNIPTFWMWGDHEVNNDFLNSIDAIELSGSGTRASGEHVTLDNSLWLAANKAYSKIAEASPPSFDVASAVNGIDGKTYAYGVDLGPVRFFLHDRNSSGECHNCTPDIECAGGICGEIAGHEPYPENFGKTQMNHLKNWLDDSSHPFKILFSGITVGGHSVLENQPWLSWWPSEFHDFETFVDNSPNLNGTNGNFIYVAGDRHNFAVHERSKLPPQNGNANFMEYYIGTINGTNNHTAVPLGEVQNGCAVVYSESAGPDGHDHWLTVLAVTQNELKFTSWNKYQKEIYSGTLRHGAGNHFVKGGAPVPGLKAFDIGTTTMPFATEEILPGGGSIVTDGTTAFLADGYNGMHIIDITDPLNMTAIAEFTNDYVLDIGLFQNHALLSGGWRGIDVVNISDPTTPLLIGHADTFAHASARKIEVAENHAYLVTSGLPSLQAIDVVNPDMPVLVAWINMDAASSLRVGGGYVYVADGNQGLKVVAAAKLSETTVAGVDELDFVVPTGLPSGVYDVTAINPNGTVYKASSALTITSTIINIDHAGKPHYNSGKDFGFYIWQDADDGEWHIRWSGDGISTFNFSGSISSAGDFSNVRTFRYGSGDTLSQGTGILSFDAFAGAGEDGLDFFVPVGATVTFDLLVNGNSAGGSISIGAAATVVSQGTVALVSQAPQGVSGGGLENLATVGSPVYIPAQDAGYFLWQDGDDGEWHVRWSGDSITTFQYEGIISSTLPISNTRQYSFEGNDSLTVSASELRFNAWAGAGEDGLDFFVPEGARVSFSLLTNQGSSVTGTHIGSNNVNPSTMPFTLLSIMKVSPNGIPAYVPAQDAGYFLWQTADEEWHLRWSGDSIKTFAYEGAISSSGGITSFSTFSYEANDQVSAIPSGLSFSGPAGAGEDGLDFFVPAGSQLIFDVKVDGVTEPLTVNIGAQNTTPKTIPFSLYSL